VSHDPLLGQTVSGRFLLEELVGQGGMGRVYRARHLESHSPVALKLLKPALLGDPTLVGRFEREAAAASRLHHPNVVSVLEFGRAGPDGTLFIAMEYVEGIDLRVVLRDQWPLPEARLCHLLAQVLSALGEAHARNVIHRDLKPENIMVVKDLGEGERVKVLDFGIAKILDGDLPVLTRNDVVCGTPQYMAPEQATGAGLDARSDLYAVGVILYQLCTGRLPFDGTNAMDVLTQHVNDLPQAPRQRSPDVSISEALERLILRALEKDPARRPQSAQEFRKLLLAVVGPGAAVPAEGPSPPFAPLPTSAPPSPPSSARPAPSPPRLAPARPCAFLAAIAAAARAAIPWILRPLGTRRARAQRAASVTEPAQARDPLAGPIERDPARTPGRAG
jgi:serine/threonine-protein kinase